MITCAHRLVKLTMNHCALKKTLKEHVVALGIKRTKLLLSRFRNSISTYFYFEKEEINEKRNFECASPYRQKITG